MPRLKPRPTNPMESTPQRVAAANSGEASLAWSDRAEC